MQIFVNVLDSQKISALRISVEETKVALASKFGMELRDVFEYTSHISRQYCDCKLKFSIKLDNLSIILLLLINYGNSSPYDTVILKDLLENLEDISLCYYIKNIILNIPIIYKNLQSCFRRLYIEKHYERL